MQTSCKKASKDALTTQALKGLLTLEKFANTRKVRNRGSNSEKKPRIKMPCPCWAVGPRHSGPNQATVVLVYKQQERATGDW